MEHVIKILDLIIGWVNNSGHNGIFVAALVALGIFLVFLVITWIFDIGLRVEYVFFILFLEFEVTLLLLLDSVMPTFGGLYPPNVWVYVGVSCALLFFITSVVMFGLIEPRTEKKSVKICGTVLVVLIAAGSFLPVIKYLWP